MKTNYSFLEKISWNYNGLVPAIIQCKETQKVLMFAWMNQESLTETVQTKRTVFWSRSRNCLWFKGKTSGAFQEVKNIRLDCDGDCLLIEVKQLGRGACHTGSSSCFFRLLVNSSKKRTLDNELYEDYDWYKDD